MARQARAQVPAARFSQAPTLEQLRDAVSTIFGTTLDKLSSNVPKVPPEGNNPRLFFPNGINYISIDVTFEPNKLDFKVDLVVSSEPVHKLLTTEETP
jgi:hypothetical protein